MNSRKHDICIVEPLMPIEQCVRCGKVFLDDQGTSLTEQCGVIILTDER